MTNDKRVVCHDSDLAYLIYTSNGKDFGGFDEVLTKRKMLQYFKDELDTDEDVIWRLCVKCAKTKSARLIEATKIARRYLKKIGKEIGIEVYFK